MSRKLFEKVKQAGKSIKNPFSNNNSSQSSPNNSWSKSDQQPQRKQIKKSFQYLKSNLGNLKGYVKQSFIKGQQKQSNNENFSKNKQIEPQEGKKVNLSDFFQKSFEKIKNPKQTKQFLANKMQKMKQNARQLSKGSNQTLSQLGKTLFNKKDKASDLSEQLTKKISSSAEKIKKETLGKINSATDGKISFFNKILNKMFWKVAMLIGLGLFAYGLGSSLPRQIRLHLRKMAEKDSQKVGKQSQMASQRSK